MFIEISLAVSKFLITGNASWLTRIIDNNVISVINCAGLLSGKWQVSNKDIKCEEPSGVSNDQSK